MPDNPQPIAAPFGNNEPVYPVYTAAGLERELRQGEIITDLVQYDYDLVAQGAIGINIPIAIVLSQDCDLLQDFEKIQNGEASSINGILLYEARLFSEGRSLLGTSDKARRAKQNDEVRFQFLEEIPAAVDCLGLGIGAMIVDFKKFFTLSSANIYQQVSQEGNAKRRCRLEAPYREHIQSRAAYYLSRVALPVPHRSPDPNVGAASTPSTGG